MDELGIRLEPGEPGQGPRLRLVGVGRLLADAAITVRYPARGKILSLAGWGDDPNAKVRVTQQVVERDLLLTIPRRCASAIDPGTPVEIEITEIGCFVYAWSIEEPLAVGVDTKSVPVAPPGSSERAGAGSGQGPERRQPTPKPDGSSTRHDPGEQMPPPTAADAQRRTSDLPASGSSGPQVPVMPDATAAVLPRAWAGASNPPPAATDATTAATDAWVGDSIPRQPAASGAKPGASDAWIGESIPRQPAPTAGKRGTSDTWVGDSVPPPIDTSPDARRGWTPGASPPPPPPDVRHGGSSAWVVAGHPNGRPDQSPPFAVAGFHDRTLLTRWLRVFLCVSIAVHGLAFMSDLVDWLMLHMATLEPWMEAAADSFYVRQDLIIILQLATIIIVGCLFLRWTYWANRNAGRLGARLGFTPGWSVGWYFVPVANLWKPYEAMKEIWRASLDPANWQARRPTGLLPWWWFLLLLAGGLSGVSCALRLRVLGDEAIIEDVVDMVTVGMSSAMASVVLAILTLVLIGQIFRMQMSHLRRS